MLTPVFSATVEKNKLVFKEPNLVSMWLNNFVGKTVEVVIKQRRKPRSTGKVDENGNQNGYYHAVVIPICCNFTGYNSKEMHEILIEQFAPYTIKKFGNKNVEVKIRSSEMDTVQFMEYIESIRTVMAEMGVIIPEPDKVNF